MSIKITSAVWEHSSSKGSELLCELAIADNANDEGKAWPSIPTIAKKIRMSERQTMRIIKKIIDKGELEKAHQGNVKSGSNVYQFTFKWGGLTSDIAVSPDKELTPDIAVSRCQDVTPDTRVTPTPDMGVTQPLTQLCPPNRKEPSLEPSLTSSVQSSLLDVDGSSAPLRKEEKKPSKKRPKKEPHPMRDPIMKAYTDSLPHSLNGYQWPTEKKWAEALATDGAQPDEVEAFVKLKMGDAFWQGKHMSLKYVHGNLGAWKAGGMKATANRSGKGSFYENDTSRADHPGWAALSEARKKRMAERGEVAMPLTREYIDSIEF